MELQLCSDRFFLNRFYGAENQFAVSSPYHTARFALHYKFHLYHVPVCFKCSFSLLNHFPHAFPALVWFDLYAENAARSAFHAPPPNPSQLFNRLKQNPSIDKVFDSRIHGDPATPLFKAFCGERVILRLLMPADKPRNIGFVLHGHTWKAQQDDPLSNTISAQGAISVGGSYNIELDGGASLTPGDYQYRSGSLRWDVESGMWGIFRVLRSGIKRRCESAGRHILCWYKNRFSKD